MLKELGIPDDPRIDIVLVSNGDYRLNPTKTGHINFHAALVVGNNYKGVILWEHVQKLGDLAAPNVQMKWYLDSERWQWMRRPRQKKVREVSSVGACSMCSLLWPFFFNAQPHVDKGAQTAAHTTVDATATKDA